VAFFFVYAVGAGNVRPIAAISVKNWDMLNVIGRHRGNIEKQAMGKRSIAKLKDGVVCRHLPVKRV
jgi:hypothetical protein